jgi:hypothetical protein
MKEKCNKSLFHHSTEVNANKIVISFTLALPVLKMGLPSLLEESTSGLHNAIQMK